jgi:hypothetical protein
MLCATLLLGLMLWTAHAGAHLMPAQQGALHVQGASVLAMVALPVSGSVPATFHSQSISPER